MGIYYLTSEKGVAFFLPYLVRCVNKALEKFEFSDPIKLFNTVPVYKKEDLTDKTNYKPFRVLLLLSKVFEKVIYEQLYEYLNNYLNGLLCGFCEAHSVQYALFRLIQS